MRNVNKIYCNLIVALLCYHQMQLRMGKIKIVNGRQDKKKHFRVESFAVVE